MKYRFFIYFTDVDMGGSASCNFSDSRMCGYMPIAPDTLYWRRIYDEGMYGNERRKQMWTRAPFHYRFFHRNSNSMEISFHSHLDSKIVIATKFCTWHDSCAVVACAKICCDLMASNGIMTSRSFRRIWIAGKKPLVKRAPGVPKAGIWGIKR